MMSASDRKHPVVGVTADIVVGAEPSHPFPQEPVAFLAQRYTEALMGCGAIPVILPPLSVRSVIRELLEQLDGILISGGNFDIDPRFYDEEPCAGLGEIKEERTRFELELISLGVARELPILGICGGEQAINVALGGSLYQDIRTQIPRALPHELSAARATGGHLVQLRAGTKLREIVAQDLLEVNTTHHQSIKTVGHGLIVAATSEDGVIEGIESKHHSFVIGVQWHPELLMRKEPAQQRIFASFVSACRTARRSPN